MVGSEAGLWTPPSFKTRLLVYLFFCSSLSSLLFLRGYRTAISDKEWDVLIFTQHWPNTVCMTWEEKNPTNNTCRFPPKKDSWTIHGIWPTKLGTKGPTFCNASNLFNISNLEPVQNNLTELWTDIEIPQPPNSFWKHEWTKHGTCAAVLPTLDTELKYFKQGLEWMQKYDMDGILIKGGVMPDSNKGFDVTDIWLAIKQNLRVNPAIYCIHDKKTSQDFLFEIRICFDKNLQLTNCDGIRLREQFEWQPLGNCPINKPIFYPSSVPSPNRKPIPPPADTPIVSYLKTLRFLQWLTS